MPQAARIQCMLPQRDMAAAGRHRLRIWLLVFALTLSAQAAGADTRERLARHPSTDAATLRTLAGDPDWRVRAAVAANRRAPEDVLALLARDPRRDVKIKVATNLSTPEAVFLALARDPDETVRSVVARFEYVPASALRVLARDPSPDIHLEVARAYNVERTVLEQLAKDEYAEVRAAAVNRLAAPTPASAAEAP